MLFCFSRLGSQVLFVLQTIKNILTKKNPNPKTSCQRSETACWLSPRHGTNNGQKLLGVAQENAKHSEISSEDPKAHL